MFSFDNFTSVDYVLSFSGMIMLVVLFTQFTKKIADKIKENHTRLVVYLWAFVFCAFAAFLVGDFSSVREVIKTIVMWLVNSVLVWFSARKMYEDVINIG